MTDTIPAPELPTLAPLEPLDPVAGSPGGEDATLTALRAGLPAPAFNPQCRDKSYYRFLFAGVLMFVGCMMPFSANTAVAGYQTMSGGVFLLIAIGMIWTWWGAISNNRSTAASLKWLLLCAIPLAAGVMAMVAYDSVEAVKAAVASGYMKDGPVSTWGTLFSDMFAAGRPGAGSIEPAQKVSAFWTAFGPGKFFVTLGGLFAELGFLSGILGGAKQNKQLKQNKQMTAAERKRK